MGTFASKRALMKYNLKEKNSAFSTKFLDYDSYLRWKRPLI